MARRGTRQGTPSVRATLRFTALGAAGDGVAEFEGRRVFAVNAAPGDVALAEVAGDRAEIIDWIEKSGLRREPECPHTIRCGGCALQHVATGAYAAFKKERIVSALVRVGINGAPVREPILIAPATRRRATFAVRRRKDGVAFGFNARRSAEIVAIDDCRILAPELHRRLPALRRLAEAVPAQKFDVHATLCDNGLDVDLVGPALVEPTGAGLARLIVAAGDVLRVSMNGDPLFAVEPPRVSFDGVSVTPPPGAFLQASKEGEAVLIELVRGAAGTARRVADLFCGCGALSLPLAAAAQVDAFDADRAAVAALNAAAKEAQRQGAARKARGECRDLFETPLRAGELDRYDAVVFDPPRAGAGAQAGELARSKVALVVAVSCNPDTFARDAAILSHGGYTLHEVTPVDQFVYTAHVELVGVFRRS